MKKIILLVVALAATIALKASSETAWIRINQLGYLPNSIKVAVFISNQNQKIGSFQLCDALTDKVVFTGKAKPADGSNWGMKAAARLDFSSFNKQGGYYIRMNGVRTYSFRIANDVYNGTADFLLKYMRQQRCGFNPFLKDSCHLHDGFIVDHPTRTGEIIDVTGGWHDASDYLQYGATSSNAIYQMLFAYHKNPDAFGDKHDAAGLEKPNGIPDILDEAKWGLEWLLKMYPEKDVMFNQIADDRDHRGYRLPNKDTVSYGNGLLRPVYYITGKPQGLGNFKNRATGVSSTAGKYSAAFALGAVIFKEIDPELAQSFADKAKEAFEFGLADLGVSQTACMLSPYFYEEDNYVDDLQLAAFELYRLTNDASYLKQSAYWGSLEHVTPWMGRDTARHYQYYPFVNLGHANIAASGKEYSQEFIAYMRKGLKGILDRGKNDPFLIGIPFIWCSNNLVAAAVTQTRLYNEISGDDSFNEMEASLRDWLLGCNPWGTSMICGLPAGGDHPEFPHSAITLLMNQTTYGGLVDGPVYNTIYRNLRGITLLKEDVYAPFQHGLAVYHDDIGDYSTNEPTMDGTASLSYYFSRMEMKGKKAKENVLDVKDNHGSIIKRNTQSKNVYLMFSADEHGDGTEYILNVLEEKNIKGSFFLTGNFLRDSRFKKDVKRMILQKHYVGPHSDKHLLYCAWENRDSLLVSKNSFEKDLKNNYIQLKKAGVQPESALFFLPPYEWYNSTITDWARNKGVQVVNFTPGIGTNADYTTPSMSNYKSSQQLMDRLMQYEAEKGLNGTLILIHLGTHPERTDKFYHKLPEIIDMLTEKGYEFKLL
jgi:endoglucanase